MRTLFLAAALLVAPLAARADEPPACAGIAPLPDDLKGFDQPGVFSGDVIMVTLDLAVKLKLAPIETIKGLVDGQPKPGTFAGSATLIVPAAGRYGIAASSGAWINVIKDGRSMTSVDHGHVDCTVVRKVVWFDLDAGQYALQLSNAPKDSLTVMLVRQP